MREFVIPHMNKFGPGCIDEIAHIAIENKCSKALIITGPNLERIGIPNRIKDILSNGNLEYVVYANVKSNPTKDNVYEALGLYKAENCDFIIGIGGGSPGDCAKAVGILVSSGGILEDYIGLNKSEKKAPLMMIVNTTAGTASEISRAYLISDEEKQEKLIFKDINALADYTFNDPELMTGLPANITASTGMDALTHAIESYVCKGNYTLTNKMAVAAIELVFENLREAIENPNSIELRENMIYAQSLAGMAFCNSGVGLVHAMAHQLGAVYNLPHGLCNAILLPHVMEYNNRVCELEYAYLAKKLFPHKCSGKSNKICVSVLIEEVIGLSESIGTLQKLRDLGVREKDFELLAEKSLSDGNIYKNPIMPSLEDIIDIFRNAY